MRLGLTQRDLAERLGVSQPHYSKVASEAVMHSERLGKRMSAWLEEVGTTPISPAERRVRQLSRSIREQSRELASLLAHAGGNGSRRPIRRTARSPSADPASVDGAAAVDRNDGD